MKTTTSTATQYAPIYRNTAAYARENGEQRLYFASRNANEDCAHAIGKSINAHYDGSHLDTDAIIETVTAEYGAERVAYVLANTAQVMAEDGRMSRANVEWAQAIDVTIDRDRNAGFAVTAELAHATLVDALVTAYREALETAQTEPETVETTAAPVAAEAAQQPAEAAEPDTVASAPAATAQPVEAVTTPSNAPTITAGRRIYTVTMRHRADPSVTRTVAFSSWSKATAFAQSNPELWATWDVVDLDVTQLDAPDVDTLMRDVPPLAMQTDSAAGAA